MEFNSYEQAQTEWALETALRLTDTPDIWSLPYSFTLNLQGVLRGKGMFILMKSIAEMRINFDNNREIQTKKMQLLVKYRDMLSELLPQSKQCPRCTRSRYCSCEVRVVGLRPKIKNGASSDIEKIMGKTEGWEEFFTCDACLMGIRLELDSGNCRKAANTHRKIKRVQQICCPVGPSYGAIYVGLRSTSEVVYVGQTGNRPELRWRQHRRNCYYDCEPQQITFLKVAHSSDETIGRFAREIAESHAILYYSTRKLKNSHKSIYQTNATGRFFHSRVLDRHKRRKPFKRSRIWEKMCRGSRFGGKRADNSSAVPRLVSRAMAGKAHNNQELSMIRRMARRAIPPQYVREYFRKLSFEEYLHAVNLARRCLPEECQVLFFENLKSAARNSVQFYDAKIHGSKTYAVALADEIARRYRQRDDERDVGDAIHVIRLKKKKRRSMRETINDAKMTNASLHSLLGKGAEIKCCCERLRKMGMPLENFVSLENSDDLHICTTASILCPEAPSASLKIQPEKNANDRAIKKLCKKTLGGERYFQDIMKELGEFQSKSGKYLTQDSYPDMLVNVMKEDTIIVDAVDKDRRNTSMACARIYREMACSLMIDAYQRVPGGHFDALNAEGKRKFWDIVAESPIRCRKRHRYGSLRVLLKGKSFTKDVVRPGVSRSWREIKVRPITPYGQHHAAPLLRITGRALNAIIAGAPTLLQSTKAGIKAIDGVNDSQIDKMLDGFDVPLKAVVGDIKNFFTEMSIPITKAKLRDITEELKLEGYRGVFVEKGGFSPTLQYHRRNKPIAKFKASGGKKPAVYLVKDSNRDSKTKGYYLPFRYILEVVEADVENVYLKCCGECYKQVKGGPMGSNLMVGLANIFGMAIEEEHSFHESIILVKRFVDDIIIVWRTASDETLPPDIDSTFYPECTLNFESITETGTKYLGTNIRLTADNRMLEVRSAVDIEKTMKSLHGSYLKNHEIRATRKSLEHHHITHRTWF